MFKINEVRVRKINRGKFLGYSSLLIDNWLIISGVMLFEGDNGRYIHMPRNFKYRKGIKNSVYPITDKAKEALLKAVSDKYDEVSAKEES